MKKEQLKAFRATFGAADVDVDVESTGPSESEEQGSRLATMSQVMSAMKIERRRMLEEMAEVQQKCESKLNSMARELKDNVQKHEAKLDEVRKECAKQVEEAEAKTKALEEQVSAKDEKVAELTSEFSAAELMTEKQLMEWKKVASDAQSRADKAVNAVGEADNRARQERERLHQTHLQTLNLMESRMQTAVAARVSAESERDEEKRTRVTVQGRLDAVENERSALRSGYPRVRQSWIMHVRDWRAAFFDRQSTRSVCNRQKKTWQRSWRARRMPQEGMRCRRGKGGRPASWRSAECKR